MLQTTQADEEHGAVRDIMCRVCFNRRFRKWVTLQRHCKSCEKHFSELKFCGHKCGGYFGRQDSEVCDKDKKHQGACLSTSQDEAREEEPKARRILEAFEARLQHCLRSGEDPRPRFSAVMSCPGSLRIPRRRYPKRRPRWKAGHGPPDCVRNALPFSSFRQSYRIRLRYFATDNSVVSSLIYVLFLFPLGVALYIFCSIRVDDPRSALDKCVDCVPCFDCGRCGKSE
ncbi:hypothetical protein EDB89DRAFT_1547837 [Lactarius sanguifluus]|nr:hypothetical protein EDB89DRAFT_1547837 [Lactarius sanguifluus]